MHNAKLRTVARYVIPAICSNVCFFLFTIVDAIFVGRGVGTNALGAINLAGPAILMVGAVNMLISIGGVAIYAVRIGQGDVDGANDVFRHGILLQLCASAVFSLAGIFFADGICALLGANETFHHFAVDYLFWYSIFIIPSGLSTGLQNYCRNDNAPGLVSMVVIVTTICNIFGDWLLIFPFKMGTKGAAIATGVSQTIGLMILLTRFARKQGNLCFGRTKLNAGIFRAIVVHGLPEGISQLSNPVMTLCMNFVLIQRIGDLGVNAFSVISYIASFSITAFFGASEGLQPLFGQSYGAKNETDLKYYLKTGLTISAVGSILITGLSILLGKPICVLFGTDAVTTEYIIKYLPQFAIGFIITAVNVMISAYLYSTERSALSTGINILRSLVINSAVILILPHIFGDGAIWFSLLVYEAIVLVIAVGLLQYSERNGIRFK